MAALPTWFSQPREASRLSSSHLSLRLLILQQLLQPRHQLRVTRQLVVDAAVTVAQQREPVATSRNQRAATSQATLAEVESPPHLPPSRPLHHLLSPSTTSGRRRVMSLGRPEMPTFSSLNLDGSSSPSPAPPPPLQPSAWICYDDCENDMHCSDCGKCYALCPEHSGCNCGDEDGLEFNFHCAVCCCGRSLEHEECKLRSLLSPEDYHTASHPYL